MKKIFVLLIVFTLTIIKVDAASKINIKLPLKGQSIASKLLQYDTLKAVIPAASQFNESCNSYSIIDTILVNNIQDGVIKDNKYIEGNWVEVWVVKRCNQAVAVPIMFYLDGKGGTYYKIEYSLIKVLDNK